MHPGWIGLIVAVVIVLVIAGTAAGISARRRRLRKRFGPEYDRLITEHQSRRHAEAELSNRERRVQKLSLRDLGEDARQRYAGQWAQVQEQFVDAPHEAFAKAQSLVESVMRERGYPAENYEQELADLSVDHARTLDRFRSAHDISVKAAAGQASTEELRTAMLHYRELFDELLPSPTTNGRDMDSDPRTSGVVGTDTVPPQRAGAVNTASGSERSSL